MMRQHVTRRIILGAFMVALTVLVSGLAAAPAWATSRDEGRDQANDFIASCFASGGDPVVIEATDGRIFVICYKGADTVYCQFYPTYYCRNEGDDGIPNSGGLPDGPWVVDLTGDHNWVVDPGEAVSDPVTSDPGPPPTVDASESVVPVVAARAADDREADEDTPTSKKGKKGKHGKKGAKNRNR